MNHRQDQLGYLRCDLLQSQTPMWPIPDISPTHEPADRQRGDARIGARKFAAANPFVKQRRKFLVELPPISRNPAEIGRQKVLLFTRENRDVFLAFQHGNDEPFGDQT